MPSEKTASGIRIIRLHPSIRIQGQNRGIRLAVLPQPPGSAIHSDFTSQPYPCNLHRQIKSLHDLKMESRTLASRRIGPQPLPKEPVRFLNPCRRSLVMIHNNHYSRIPLFMRTPAQTIYGLENILIIQHRNDNKHIRLIVKNRMKKQIIPFKITLEHFGVILLHHK